MVLDRERNIRMGKWPFQTLIENGKLNFFFHFQEAFSIPSQNGRVFVEISDWTKMNENQKFRNNGLTFENSGKFHGKKIWKKIEKFRIVIFTTKYFQRFGTQSYWEDLSPDHEDIFQIFWDIFREISVDLRLPKLEVPGSRFGDSEFLLFG